MRLCRYQHNGDVEVALYYDDHIVNVNRTAQELKIPLPKESNSVLDYLPPSGKAAKTAMEVDRAFQKLGAADKKRLGTPLKGVKLRIPIADPGKVILLAGNYAEHIVEGGGEAVERRETFPYFFWKPNTALTNTGDPIRIPKVSPDHVDWELELGVVIGRKARHVTEKDALRYVAGYTVCNDVSDRQFQLNPKRKERKNDPYFDWLHGKWHDTFLPMGPCVSSAKSLPNPQKLKLTLKVNDKTMQDASTAQKIFPVAAIVSILSSFTTLEPGDVIATGTPSGVGKARKPPIFLKPKDVVTAEIEGIGVLENPVAAEKRS